MIAKLGKAITRSAAFVPWFLLLGATLEVWRRFDEIPKSYPLHFGTDGRPDRWVDKSAFAVVLPLTIGATACALLAVLHRLLRPGNAPPKPRGAALTVASMVLLGELVVASLFAAVALMPLWGPGVVLVTAGAAPIVVIVFALLPKGERPPPTDSDRYWHGGFYWNRDDPAVMVPGRYGSGTTFNFGRGVTWFLLIGMVVYLVASIVLVHVSSHR